MPEYRFHPTLLLRTPVYSYSYYSENNLAQVLLQSFFRKAIYFSSEVFYNELEKADFDLNKLDKKAIDTLKKYFNRMCLRPTPFGICAAFGSIKWDQGETAIKTSPNNLKPHILFSYAKNLEYAATLLTQPSAEGDKYRLTQAIYKTGNEYRFIRSNHDNLQMEFVIDSIANDAFFERLLRYLSSWHTLTNISTYVCLKTGCSDEQAKTYVQWLTDSQLISRYQEPNITGQDYLARLLAERSEQSLKAAFKMVKSVESASNLAGISGNRHNLNSDNFYVNLEIKLPQAQLSSNYQPEISNALECLSKLTQQVEITDLKNFKNNFLKKFDQQTIPLLLALDPESGVGYGDLAVDEGGINIAKNIVGSTTFSNTTINWSKTHSLLFFKWKNLPNQDHPITITDADLQELDIDNASVPNTQSVMFRIVEDKVLIESAGGNTATALVGRFTPFNSDIKQLARDMAAAEAQANPDVIFAEIAHICHDKTANIDRREHLYAYEIPVLVQSTMRPEQQIPLTDLWVSVLGGKIIVQSKKLNKRIIPRLSSAFNYTRNDLAVFRFLCDLQKADVKTNLGFNLNKYFPGMNHYPRVEYKNTILQLANWTIKKQFFAQVLKPGSDNRVVLFNQLRSQLKLPALIALTQADNQLVFNLDDEQDVLFFLDTIKSLQQITLKEYLLPSVKNPIVTDDNQQPYINQFVTSVYHERQIYQPVITTITETKGITRKFIPGSEWLYLKLYCHPIRSNYLLIKGVGTILKKLNKDNLLDQWFFIRYADPDYHVRLRLKIEPQNQSRVTGILHNLISPYVIKGLISDYSFNIYEREQERYSPTFMPQFEYIFYASSNLVLEFLKQQGNLNSDKAVLEFAMVSVKDLLTSLNLEGKLLITFLDGVFNSFANEFKNISDLKYQLDTEFRKQKTIIEVLKAEPDYYKLLKLTKARNIFTGSLLQLKIAITAKNEWKDKWIADLIHMHLNRLFVNDSRKQEMMIYYFMLKHERSVQARAAAK